MNPQTQSTESFDTLGISEKFLEILKHLHFIVPTPIQHKAIPIAIAGKDIIGIAQTGTGKTLAFGIPMIQRLAQVNGKGLVLLPTRELAIQVEEVLKKIGGSLGLRTAVLIGGASMQLQNQALRKNPHIIIATPGRLIDHTNQRTVDLSLMKIVVLDEADRMLDMGFAPQIKKILQLLPRERQTMLFSATMPGDIVRLANQHMKLPLQIEIARAGTLAERVDQELYMVHKEDKIRLLETLLNQYKGTVLVFSRTKHGARKICRSIMSMNHRAIEIHSNRTLAQRRDAMAGFKSGKYRVLVATDIAARGIDVTGIEVVINFDIPDDPGDYVHRIGRTGRAGEAGKAITFVAPDQRGKVRDIERLTRTTLSLSQTPALAAARQVAFTPRPEQSRQSSFNRGGDRRSSGTYSDRPRSSAPYQPSKSFSDRPRSSAPRTGSSFANRTNTTPSRYPSSNFGDRSRGPLQRSIGGYNDRPRTFTPRQGTQSAGVQPRQSAFHDRAKTVGKKFRPRSSQQTRHVGDRDRFSGYTTERPPRRGESRDRFTPPRPRRGR